jgi:hypothetical protein
MMLSFLGFEPRAAASLLQSEVCSDEACLVWNGDGQELFRFWAVG